ncbi:MAG: polyisoprenoid-binding protein [Phycisphaerae bacterium]|nr:polyisoprenoid-binding protein [Phycisphaerae bacterium]
MKRMIRNRISVVAGSLLAVGLLGASAAWGPLAINTAAAAGSLAAATTSSADTVYEVDGVHSVVLFRIRHSGVGFFWGRFNKGDGEFFIDEENPSNSFFRATIDMNSVDTGNEKRDDHLKASDFFNARQYGEATFESTGFTAKGGENMYELTGNLTLMGETRPVTATVEYGGSGEMRGKKVQGFEATFEIKRSDFGITTYLPPDRGDGGPLGNTVRITLGVEGSEK